VFAKLLALFIIVPLLELAIFIALGDYLGLPTTLAIIVFTGILGAALTKSQGARALNRFRLASAEGRLPHQEVVDGLLILIAGAVLLTPGFLTDTVGFLLLVPPVRALFRSRLGNYLKSKIQIIPTGPLPGAGPPQPRSVDGTVIDVDTVPNDSPPR
jgi:UPF0716 protein FxsA